MAQSLSSRPPVNPTVSGPGVPSVLRRVGRWALLVATVALIVVWSLAERPRPEAGERLPAMAFPVVSAGGPSPMDLDLATIGEPVVVEVFASWCGVCRQGTPRVAALVLAPRQRPVHFIGVSVDSTEAAARSIVRDWRVDYPVLHDPKRQLAAAWNITALPTFIVADGEGDIEAVLVGVPAPEVLERHLAEVGAPRR